MDGKRFSGPEKDTGRLSRWFLGPRLAHSRDVAHSDKGKPCKMKHSDRGKPRKRSEQANGSKPAIALIAALALAFSLAACSSNSDGTGGTTGTGSSADASAGTTTGGWPRTIKTDDGELTLDKQPETIVSTSVTLTGSLLAIDAPVVASGATGANVAGLSDENGFFLQWSDEAAQAGVEKLYENASPQIERVAEYAPDLIVVSATGGDSAMDQIEQLREIAPVIVVDYGSRSWQETTELLGLATGHEEDAQKVIDDYERRVAEVKENITLPEGTTSPFTIFTDGSGAAALTEESAQGQALIELGFTLAEIPDEVRGDTSMGQRSDIVELSTENIQRGLTGDNWIVVAADDASMDAVANDPAFNTAPQVTEGRIVYTPSTTFRLDYYSALQFIDAIEEAYQS